jgi:tetratricopeptide (TPR) repeat protein
MQRMMLGALVSCSLALGAALPVAAGEVDFAKRIKALNELTGVAPTEGMLRQLIAQPDQTKELIKAALPLAEKDGALSYNAALALAFAAGNLRDYKSCDVFFHVCGRIAAREQSTRKLAQAYVTLIRLYYGARQYQNCVRVCREVLNLKTDDGKERFVLKPYTDELGNTEYTEYPKFGTVTAPFKVEVQRYFAQALAKQGKFDEALKLADGLIRGPTDWYNKWLKAQVLHESGENAAAAKLYEDVLPRAEREKDLDAEDRAETVEQMRAELSNIYVELKQIDKAAGQLEVLVKQKPTEPGYYNDLGYILADHGMRLDEAEKLVRKALELDKEKRAKSPSFNPKTDHDNGAYLDSLGWVLFKKKQYAEARKYLEQAVEDENTKHIEIYDHLGDVCQAMGDRDGAIRAWEEGLKHVTQTRRDQERRTAVERKLERAKSKSASK